MSARACLRLATLFSALFAALTVLVHARLLASADVAALTILSAHRPEGATDVMNWIFRLGFVQVDAAIAVLWSAWALASRRSVLAALPPLLLFGAVGVQAGLRLVVDQPGPPKTFEVDRPFARQPVEAVLDRTDAAAREAFVATTAPPAAPTRERGSYPSGHATRSLFLALLAANWLGSSQGRALRKGMNAFLRTLSRRLLRAALPALALLVGYSALYFGYHWPSDVLGGYLLGAIAYLAAVWVRSRSWAGWRRAAVAGRADPKPPR